MMDTVGRSFSVRAAAILLKLKNLSKLEAKDASIVVDAFWRIETMFFRFSWLLTMIGMILSASSSNLFLRIPSGEDE